MYVTTLEGLPSYLTSHSFCSFSKENRADTSILPSKLTRFIALLKSYGRRDTTNPPPPQ